MSKNDWKVLSEICVNLAGVLAIIAGPFILVHWLYQRRDRSAEVLFRLEELFNSPVVQLGRSLVESDRAYLTVSSLLIRESLTGEHSKSFLSGDAGDGSTKHSEQLQAIDALLRFYILLFGLKRAHQAPDASLRICYAYWLTQYHNPARRELRLYIHAMFPTLARWIRNDRGVFKRKSIYRFFIPEHFGWRLTHRLAADELHRRLRGKVLVITGAGISAESNIPTYRGAGGIWKNRDPRKLATRTAFDEAPDAIWEWYNYRRRQVREAKPNMAHEIVSSMAAVANQFLVVTQNVDNLHERTERELSQSQLCHIHGEILKDQCTNCRKDKRRNDSADQHPQCAECGSLMRPAVVWFDEDLPTRQVARVLKFISGEECDLVITIGTSASFDYVVEWAIRAAGRGGHIIDVNTESQSSALLAAADELWEGTATMMLQTRILPLLK